MTSNSNWSEIKDNLHPNTTHRYDIVNRTFHVKVIISDKYTQPYVHGGMAKARLTTHTLASVANKQT